MVTILRMRIFAMSAGTIDYFLEQTAREFAD